MPFEYDYSEREFHDSGGIFLYFMYMIILLFAYFGMPDSNLNFVAYKLVDCSTSLKIIFVNILFVSIFILSILILTYSFPKAFFYAIFALLYLFCFCAIILAIFLSNSDNQNSENSFYTITGALLTINSFTILKKKDILSRILRIPSKIFFEYFPIIFILSVICTVSLYFIGLSMSFIVCSKNETLYLGPPAAIFFIWSFVILFSLMDVFVSSIVQYSLTDKNSGNGLSIVIDSLKNSFYSIGSVIYGTSLLPSIIEAFPANIDSRIFNDRNNGAMILVIIIVSLILFSVVKCIFTFSHNIIYPYLAVKKDKYSNAATASFEIIEAIGLDDLFSYGDLFLFTAIVSWIFCVILYYFNLKIVFPIFSISKNRDLYAGIVTAIFTLFFYYLYSLIRSLVMALIFATTRHSFDTNKFQSSFIDFLQKKDKETDQRNNMNRVQLAPVV